MEALIALSTKTRTLKRNEYLKLKGSIDSNIYFIEQGSVRIFAEVNAQEQTFRLGYSNNIIVLLDSYLSGLPSVFAIQAIKKTVVKIIPKDQVTIFLKKEENQRFWVILLEKLVLQQMEREIDLLTSSPKERYLRVVQRSPQLFQEVPHKHIANYLRMSPETLSRLKKS